MAKFRHITTKLVLVLDAGTVDGKKATKRVTISNIREDASADALWELAEALGRVLAYPVAQVRLYREEAVERENTDGDTSETGGVQKDTSASETGGIQKDASMARAGGVQKDADTDASMARTGGVHKEADTDASTARTGGKSALPAFAPRGGALPGENAVARACRAAGQRKWQAKEGLTLAHSTPLPQSVAKLQRQPAWFDTG